MLHGLAGRQGQWLHPRPLDQFSDAAYEDPRAELIEETLEQEEAAGLGPRAPVESVENSADNVDRGASMIEVPEP